MDVFDLTSIYPNSFNAVARIMFSIPQVQNVSLKIFDSSGREVADLVKPGMLTSNGVTWNAHGVANGTYFVRLAVGSEVRTSNMVLLK